MEWIDDLQRKVKLSGPPQRIVSLVPSITETLFALGLRESIIGVTRYCTHPPGEVKRLEKVGGTKNPDIGKILTLRPDLVIVNAEENRQEDFARLIEEGLVIYVTFPRTVEEGILMIGRVGEVVGVPEIAHQMVNSLLGIHREVILSVEQERRLKVFCPIWRNPWMSFNRETYVDNMLWCCGGENILRHKSERFFPITLNEVAALSPEVVLLPDEPYSFTTKHIRNLKPLADTPAGRGGHIYCVDGKGLSWYGPRIGEGLRSIHKIFLQVIATWG
jgi:ABC-type Fe3+-hydroxamate transport system substrate-binding protein